MYMVKTYIWNQECFGFNGAPLLLRGFSQACGRPYYNGRSSR